jgi:Type II intron maturase/Reverse transcriptase (RNA-dependent DNA polymerase)
MFKYARGINSTSKYIFTRFCGCAVNYITYQKRLTLQGNTARNKRSFERIFSEVRYIMDKLMNLYNFVAGYWVPFMRGVINYVVLIVLKYTKQPSERIRLAKESPKMYNRRIFLEFGIARSMEVLGRRRIHSTANICGKESSLLSFDVLMLSGINYKKELKKLKSRLDEGLKANNLSRIMSDPNFLNACWVRIRSSNSNITPVFEETLDELNIDWFEKVASGIRNGSYNFKPLRKTHLSKLDGKQHLFVMFSFKDKIVQEGMRFLLELIYESKFLECSYARKQNQSCHNVLMDIRKKCKTVNWYIKGDIDSLFPMIDYHFLVSLIRKNVDDQAFIDLLFKYIRIEFGEILNNNVKPMKIGFIQSKILLSILINIYLHFFDKWVINDLKMYFDKGENKNLRFIVSNDFNWKRMLYFRYVGNFIIGVDGSKKDALNLMFEVKKFLSEKLKFTFNEIKIFITHADTESVKFLGYKIYKIPLKKIFAGQNKKGLKSETIFKTLLNAPISDIVVKLINKGYVKRNGRPTSNGRLINLHLYQIINHYKTVERSIFNYYFLANNYKNLVVKVHFLLKYSCVLTFASKMRLKTMKGVFKKYGKDLRVKSVKGFVTYSTPSYKKFSKLHKIMHFDNKFC